MFFDEYLKLIGRTFYFLRKRKGLTQKELSQFVGITYRYYQDIEKGKVNLTFNLFFKLSTFFGLNIEQFFELATNVNECKVSNEESFNQLLVFKKLLKENLFVSDESSFLKKSLYYSFLLENRNLEDIEKSNIRGAVVNSNFCTEWVSSKLNQDFGIGINTYCIDVVPTIDEKQKLIQNYRSILDRERPFFYDQKLIRTPMGDECWVASYTYPYKGKIFNFCEDLPIDLKTQDAYKIKLPVVEV